MAATEFGHTVRRWRDRVSPEAAGLPVDGHRRAAGLRREELALLAGISVDYVTRLEQGRATNPSEQVVEALGRALRLSGADREHLFHVARLMPPGRGTVPAYITPSVQRMLDRLTGTPVAVSDATWTLLLANPMYTALMGQYHGNERNAVWRNFLGSGSRVRHTPQSRRALEAAQVSELRATASRYPADQRLRRLVAELRASSGRFAELWESGAVGRHEASKMSYNAVVVIHYSTLSRLTPVAEDQWGLVTRRQAERAGVSPATLQRMASSGVLDRVAHGVYRLAGTAPSSDLGLRAAWLQLAPEVPAWDRTPEQGVVSHRSAAALYGLGHLPADRHDFTLPERQQSRQPDIRLHERPIRQNEWAMVGGLPVTRPSRIAADLLDDREEPEAVAYVVADAIRPGHDDPGTIADALAPYAARLGLRRGDGLALLRWLLDLTDNPDTPRWIEEAAAYAARSSACDDRGPLPIPGGEARSADQHPFLWEPLIIPARPHRQAQGPGRHEPLDPLAASAADGLRPVS